MREQKIVQKGSWTPLPGKCVGRHVYLPFLWLMIMICREPDPSNVLFVWFDSLRPSQQFSSYVWMGLPGLNQFWARINVSCSRTQHSDAGEGRTVEPEAPQSRVKHSTTEPLCFTFQCYCFHPSLLTMWYTVIIILTMLVFIVPFNVHWDKPTFTWEKAS